MVENFGPGALDRMGFTWEHIRELNPGMIVASVKGFSDGHHYEDLKVYENVAQCAGGAASRHTSIGKHAQRTGRIKIAAFDGVSSPAAKIIEFDGQLTPKDRGDFNIDGTDTQDATALALAINRHPSLTPTCSSVRLSGLCPAAMGSIAGIGRR